MMQIQQGGLWRRCSRKNTGFMLSGTGKTGHYGEGGFGWMVIEYDDDEHEVFGRHISSLFRT